MVNTFWKRIYLYVCVCICCIYAFIYTLVFIKVCALVYLFLCLFSIFGSSHQIFLNLCHVMQHVLYEPCPCERCVSSALLSDIVVSSDLISCGFCDPDVYGFRMSETILLGGCRWKPVEGLWEHDQKHACTYIYATVHVNTLSQISTVVNINDLLIVPVWGLFVDLKSLHKLKDANLFNSW